MTDAATTPTPDSLRPRTRIQQKNREAILDAALGVFARDGFAGATLDRIAAEAGLSKPNLLYYFRSKEAMHHALLADLLDLWLDPLRAIDPAGEPVAEILTYVRRKLGMSRNLPRESRLFANEILQGAPRLQGVLGGELAGLVEEKAAIVRGWSAAGRIAPVHPKHLFFSVWALTQHYADFDAQVVAVLGPEADRRWLDAERHLMQLFTALLTPAPGLFKQGGAG
ncbi:MAG: TetR family transcriptional regulator C-terminal domain-containing protein [Gemmobacter sp.]|jgi:TetR/AcrR family transcriptional regulator